MSLITKKEAKASRRTAALKMLFTIAFFGGLVTLHLSTALGVDAVPGLGLAPEPAHLLVAAVLLVVLRRFIASVYLAGILLAYTDFQLLSPALVVELLGLPGAAHALAGELALAGAVVVLGLVEQVIATHARSSTTFGSARLASAWEALNDSDLATRPPGVYLGSVRLGFWEVPLYDASERHVLLAAPTGAGKTSGTIIPTLLTDPGSAIVFDPKGEIWERTAGHRAKWQRTIRLDPTRPTDCINPLDLIPRGSALTTQYALLLAEALVNPSGKEISPEKAFWNEQARDVIVAALLHVIETEDNPTLPGATDILLSSGLLDVLAESPSVYARETAESFGKFADETRGGIFANAAKAVNIFRIETIRAFTSHSTFEIDDLDDGLSIYLTLPLNQLKALKSLSRLLLTLMIQRLLEEERPGRRLLFAIDEFPVFERFDYLTEALGYLRSYGVKVLIAVQGLNNLESFYGPNQTVEMSCRTQIIYPPADRKTAEYLSKILGKYTIQTLSEGRTRGRRNSSSNASEGEAARSLLNADEIRFDLPTDEGFLLVPGIRPLRVCFRPYFRNRRLRAASEIAPSEAPLVDMSFKDTSRVLSRIEL